MKILTISKYSQIKLIVEQSNQKQLHQYFKIIAYIFKIMNNSKLSQKYSYVGINMAGTPTSKIKSPEILLEKQIDRIFSNPTSKLIKNDHMNITESSICSPKNQKMDSYSSNYSDAKIKMRKLFYDQKKKNEEYQELKHAYELLYEECKFVRQQNERLVTFLKHKLLIKQPEHSEPFQISSRLSKNGSSHLSINSLQKISVMNPKSSRYHKQQNSKLQYTIDQLIKLIDNEWTNVMRKTMDLHNMDQILSNSSHQSLNICSQDPNLQYLQNALEQKKNQNLDLQQELRKQKTKFQQQKKINEEQHIQIVMKLQSQNRMLREQITDLKADYQAQERKLQGVIKIINQKPRLTSIYRVNN